MDTRVVRPCFFLLPLMVLGQPDAREHGDRPRMSPGTGESSSTVRPMERALHASVPCHMSASHFQVPSACRRNVSRVTPRVWTVAPVAEGLVSV